MNMQEAFDRAAKGVITQGEPSIDNRGGSCRYIYEKVDKVLHCGVGHLLPDDITCRTWDLEVGSVRVAGTKRRTEAGLAELPMDFLISLQRAHDTASEAVIYDEDFVVAFKAKMRGVAKAYKLNPEVLDQ